MLCYKKDLIEGTENIKFLGKHFLTEDLFFLQSEFFLEPGGQKKK